MVIGDEQVAARSGGVPVRLRSGRWSVEVRGDEVADIRYDGVRLLRAVRPVVRDRDWNTVPVAVLSQRPAGDGSTGLVSELRFHADGIDYAVTLTVSLDDGVLVDFAGRALTSFERNRIGLVVLHPADDAGHPVEACHADGSVTAGRWPLEISPHQPFRDLTGFRWRRQGIAAALALSGDVFETEDQRNWTDASFKTYGTPLDLPFPVRVEAGDTCAQQVRLTATGRAEKVTPHPADLVVIGEHIGAALPAISVGAALYPAPERLPDRLPGWRAGYEAVLVELTGPEERWPQLLRAASVQAAALSASLDVRVVTADPAAVDRAVAALPAGRVLRLAAFDPVSHVSTPPLWAALGRAAERYGFGGQRLAGTRAHFTELNRQRDLLPTEAPGWAFSLTPQMHATEVPHLVDSLATQTTVADNARRLAGGQPLHIGPVTLARRFNAVATSGTADPAADADRAVDPLLDTDFAAAWTLASVAALARVGVAGLCYYEVVGPRGLLTDDLAPRPVATVLDRVAGLRGRPVLSTVTPEGVAGLAVRSVQGDPVLLVANLSAEHRTIRVEGAGLGPDGIRLDPYQVTEARLDA